MPTTHINLLFTKLYFLNYNFILIWSLRCFCWNIMLNMVFASNRNLITFNSLLQGFKGDSNSAREEEIQPLAVVSSSLFFFSSSFLDSGSVATLHYLFLSICISFIVVPVQDVGKSVTCQWYQFWLDWIVFIQKTKQMMFSRDLQSLIWAALLSQLIYLY